MGSVRITTARPRSRTSFRARLGREIRDSWRAHLLSASLNGALLLALLMLAWAALR